MSGIGRRAFLQGAVATTGGVLVSGPMQALLAGAAGAKPKPEVLAAVADERDGVVRLHLPRGFEYRSFHDTDTLLPPLPRPRSNRRSSSTTGRCCQGATTAWPPSRGRMARSGWSATTRSTAPRAAFGPGAPYDTMTAGRHDDGRGRPLRQRRTGVHQPQRDAEELLRWADAVGQLDHLRGDGERARRRAGLHRRVERRAAAAPRVHLRGAGRRAVQPATDHVGRSVRPRGGGVQPRRGHVYLTEDNFAFPSGLYRYMPPQNPMKVGSLVNGGTLQMLRVVGQANADLEASQVNGATYQVDWVDIDDPAPTFPTRRVCRRRPRTTPPSARRQPGTSPGCGGLLPPRGRGLRQGRIYFTSTQGGGAAETGPTADLATATAPARCGRTTRSARR